MSEKFNKRSAVNALFEESALKFQGRSKKTPADSEVILFIVMVWLPPPRMRVTYLKTTQQRQISDKPLAYRVYLFTYFRIQKSVILTQTPARKS